MIRLAVRVRRADAETVLAELLTLAPAGVEEAESGDWVEYAIYGAPGEIPELPDLEAAAGDALVSVTTREVADDWDERWKQFHRPIEVGGRLHVRPPWSPPPGDDVLDVVIDPAQAFGTGAHATTRLCLELMLVLEPAGPFADVGCGSGVLAIAAAKLGWGPVLAVDFDPLSVEATCSNALVNGVSIDAVAGDLRREQMPSAPTVAANLLRPLLLVYAQRLVPPVPRYLIASGLLKEEGDEIAAAFASRGLAERERREAGEWVALLLERRVSN